MKLSIGMVAVVSLASLGCVGGKPIHYYAVTPPRVTATGPKLNGLILLVGRIATTDALEDSRIRYRSGANEVGTYEYHRWTDRPGVMVRDQLLLTLRGSGLFREVQEAGSTASGNYLISGKLFEFDEVDDGAIQTRISLHLEMLDRRTGVAVWDQLYNRNEPVNGKEMKDVVASLDRNLQHVITDSAAAIEAFLAKGA
ncbi:MAG TPA: ABC-type transport auxiliary lipoprotein family protein [Candidatus Sulfopaludibacter sp.]|jgi:cholesterol transport system auxiliary component|nr:ABC-type transport auxiliary lipoprotein family protein [Candidatus Sulfopaludibacter sp.]